MDGEVALTALGAAEGQGIDTLQIARARANDRALDQRPMQAAIARHAQGQAGAPDVVQVGRQGDGSIPVFPNVFALIPSTAN